MNFRSRRYGMRTRSFLARWALPALITALPAAAEPPAAPPNAAALSRLEFVTPQMGTLFRIVVYAPNATDAHTAVKAAFARIAELNRIFSDYLPDSEVRQLELAPRGVPVAASPELFDLLERSRQLAEKSQGAFDVTLGPAVRLWREARRMRRLPSPAERAAALAATGHAKLRLNAADRTVTLLAPGVQFDFGGIAKGYAADEALAVLARHGLTHAMVAASGDLALGDAPPGTPGWRIELAPFGPASPASEYVIAANVGISTSGEVEQFVEFNGVRYSHIVDPATALGLTTGVAVTVIAGNATASDSLATAGSVLANGAADGIAGCVGDSARAIVLRRDECGRIQRSIHGSAPPGLCTKL